MIKLNTLEPYGLNGINKYERIVKNSGLRNMFDGDIPGESRCWQLGPRDVLQIGDYF